MIITVKVKTGSRSDSISYEENLGGYLVSVKARPIEGEANKAIIELLSKELKVPKSSFSLKSGQKSKIKRFEIME
jgi:uncharacterized protein